MYRKILTLLLVGLTCILTGCGAKEKPMVESSIPEVSSKPVEVIYYTNPLTGEKNITDEEVSTNRPVAVMINNINVAQPVQTGLTKADIVYETEVEGGITRLMAVYQDIANVKKLGTVRSARYAYIDLAMGHTAIYVHHGQDPTFAAPHLKDTQSFSLDTNNAGFRVKNGLSSEHTLYAYGDKLWNALKNKGFKTKLTNPTTWQAFADEETPVTFTSAANTIKVPFSKEYKSVFKYDATSGKYIRFFKDTERKDYNTNESELFKNIFVLRTTITNYSDGKHRKIDLTSGEGYYCVNGTYIPIKWSKGAASNGFKFTNVDGTELQVNQGNSWVCIMGQEFAPSFE